MYVAGYDASYDWRIEKRRLDTGALDTGFDGDGVVTSTAGYRARALSLDSTHMYLAGEDDSADWRFEKRRLDTGALDTSFGTSGVVTSSAGETAWDLATDSSSIYAVGWITGPDWRIEKRWMDTGALHAGEIDVGAPLAALNTPTSFPGLSAASRLRLLLHVSNSDLSLSGENFKLQFAQQSGTCDTSFVGENYADVTGSSLIAYYDNPTPADGGSLTANANDPSHGVDNVVAQTYEEANNFTNSVAAVSAGEDGMWDFALVDNLATPSTTYCLRAVLSDGTLLDTYTVIPEITTASATITVDDVTQTEGTGLTFTVTLDNPVAGGFNVNVTLADVTATGGAAPLASPEDYDNVVAALTFAGTAGETQQFTVDTLDDAPIEATETFTVNINATNPNVTDSDTGTGTITDNDTTPPWPDCSYLYRARLTVSTTSAGVDAGYSASVIFDHEAMVSASPAKSLASGDDVRIFHWNGAAWT